MVPRQLFSGPSFYFQFKCNTSLNLTKTVISQTIVPSLLLYLPLSQNPSFLAVLANVDGEMRSVLGAASWQLSGPGSFEVWPSGKLGEHVAPLGGVPLGLSSPSKALCYPFAKYLCSSQTVFDNNFDNTTSRLQLRLEVEDVVQTSFVGPCDPLRSNSFHEVSKSWGFMDNVCTSVCEERDLTV